MKSDDSLERMAGANPDALIPKYKSKAEETWAVYGDALLKDEMGSDCRLQMYEPLRFKIPGGWYKPDFLHLMSDGTIVLVEVKGSKKQRGYRSSRQKLRAAAEIYPFWRWLQVIGTELEWIND